MKTSPTYSNKNHASGGLPSSRAGSSLFSNQAFLCGALMALVCAIPGASFGQESKSKRTSSRAQPEEFGAEQSSPEKSKHRSTDDFKLGGPEEPEFPPPVARLSRRTLHVQGTQGRDLIEVVISGKWLEIWISDNSNPTSPVEIFFDTYHLDEVAELRLFGLAGKDVIINETSIPDFIWGGLGNDDILAGDGVSHVFGQDGDDILNGNGGDDILWGDDGTDYLFGGPGKDLVSGDDGVDWVSGGDSFGQSDDEVDQLAGGAGGDIFTVPPAGLADDILFDYDPVEGDILNE